MSKRVWRKGAPPYAGWWNASQFQSEEAWRWWDGKRWSFAAFPEESKHEAEHKAKQAWEGPEIEWTTFWPKSARVSRAIP